MLIGERTKKASAAIQTLVDLGLTSCQARIYFALLQCKSCSAGEISRGSNVTRQEVYRIMPRLQEKGLARKILNVPIAWEATSLEEGLAILMEKKNSHLLDLKVKTAELLKSCKKMDKVGIIGNVQDFVILPRGKQRIKWWMEKLESLQESWDGFSSLENLGQRNSVFGEYFEKAIKRGVKFRNIFYTTATQKVLPNLDASYVGPNVQQRIISKPSNLVFQVLDKKEVCLRIQAEGTSQSPLTGSKNPGFMTLVRSYETLWSRNPDFRELVQDYFETQWNLAEGTAPRERQSSGQKG